MEILFLSQRPSSDLWPWPLFCDKTQRQLNKAKFGNARHYDIDSIMNQRQRSN
jgi:hypothetical protein